VSNVEIEYPLGLPHFALKPISRYHLKFATVAKFLSVAPRNLLVMPEEAIQVRGARVNNLKTFRSRSR